MYNSLERVVKTPIFVGYYTHTKNKLNYRYV